MDETDNFDHFYTPPGPDGTEPLVSFDKQPIRHADNADTSYIPRASVYVDEQETAVYRPVPDIEPVKTTVPHTDGSEWEMSLHPATGEVMGARRVKAAPDVRVVYEDRGGSVTFTTQVDRRRSPAAAQALQAAAQHLSGNNNQRPPVMPLVPGMGPYGYPPLPPAQVPMAYQTGNQQRPNPGEAPASPQYGIPSLQPDSIHSESRPPTETEATRRDTRMPSKLVRFGVYAVAATYITDFLGYNLMSFVEHPTHLANITGNIRYSLDPFNGFVDIAKGLKGIGTIAKLGG